MASSILLTLNSGKHGYFAPSQMDLRPEQSTHAPDFVVAPLKGLEFDWPISAKAFCKHPLKRTDYSIRTVSYQHCLNPNHASCRYELENVDTMHFAVRCRNR